MKKQITKDIYIVAAKRTAFGTFGGTLKDISAVELGTVAAKGALSQLGSDSAKLIDSVTFGNVAQSTTDCAYLARHVGLKAGVPIDKPSLTVNRLCGSGFQSIVTAVQEILLGESNVCLTGGAENMSLAPYSLTNIRFGLPFPQTPKTIDTLFDTLTDNFIKTPMAITAENLAEKYKISKEKCDEFAFRSQQLWKQANDQGVFKSEIEPIEVKVPKKGLIKFETDEHPKPNTTLDKLSSLKAVFKQNGVVSAGNASGISDGAGAVIVSSGEAMKANGFKPLAKIIGYAVCGVDPNIMGIGPVPAIKKALENSGLKLSDMDLIEINEAFASQFLSCAQELGLPLDKTNLSGGAIAMGHPTGASGSRIMGHLCYELKRKNKKYGVGSACIGGGQGIAVVIERC